MNDICEAVAESVLGIDVVLFPVFFNGSIGVYVGAGIAALSMAGAASAFNPLIFGTPKPENRSGHFSCQIILRNLLGGSSPVLVGFLIDRISFESVFLVWIALALILGFLSWRMMGDLSDNAEAYS